MPAKEAAGSGPRQAPAAVKTCLHGGWAMHVNWHAVRHYSSAILAPTAQATWKSDMSFVQEGPLCNLHHGTWVDPASGRSIGMHQAQATP